MSWEDCLPKGVYQRQFRDSGYLTATNTATIAAGASYVFTLNEKFKPYDEVVIVNLDSDNDCTLYINQNQQIPLAAGNRVRIDVPYISDVALINNGSTTISASKIKVTYRNSGHEGRATIGKAGTVVNLAAQARMILGW